ncbi:hypothetical protein CJ179_38350 [Rhodococcus sp. ACS1]|uniref:phage tail termination protein n=1 Tax=Rhodococcus sp. ACS1 TaxID=2028570 RepID=UPI000BB149D3|nr:hypothetical protein [Rhodococcus sp. ACS1]PBC38470.1 hypothetical protein CJ179_38350 [Rhodococcus sp. ACS1]
MAFPDAELVLLSLLDDLGYTCTALPDPDQFDAQMPIIVCNRIGGGVDGLGITDNALCAILVIHDTRPLAWQVTAQVRQRILKAGCTEVDGILIDTTSEVVGNQEVMDINPENRMVDSTFYLSFREMRS